MKYKHIAYVGVELEGIWPRDFIYTPSLMLREKHHPWRVRFHGDGSIRLGSRNNPRGWEEDVGRISLTNIEGVSDPLRPHEVPAWVKWNYPRHVNNSCGMHVHVSFKRTLDYARLMEKSFHEFVLTRLHQWGVDESWGLDAVEDRQNFLSRLEGKNRFCAKSFAPESQIWYEQKDSPHRYSQLNFAWKRYRTLEFRLLPMFDTAERSVSAIMTLLSAIETYLTTTPYDKKPVKEKIALNPKVVYANERKASVETGSLSEMMTSSMELGRFGHALYADYYFGNEEELVRHFTNMRPQRPRFSVSLDAMTPVPQSQVAELMEEVCRDAIEQLNEQLNPFNEQLNTEEDDI